MRRVCVLLALALLLPSAVTAQGNRIAYGQTVRGQITRDSFRTIYVFQGRAGDIIEASMQRTDGTLDPVLILTDETNALIAMDDDGAGDFNATLSAVKLPRDGLYFVITTRFGQERGSTEGVYTLKLSRVGIVAGSDPTGGIVLQFGDSVVNEITDENAQVMFAFTALRGDIISAQMQRISGDLDCVLILADSQGNILKTSDDDPNAPGTLDAAIPELRVLTTGNYALIATRFGQQAGTSRGGFTLELERVTADQLSLTADHALLIDLGVEYRGSIDARQIQRFYLIEAKANQVLSIEARRASGNLDPTVQLYSTDMSRLLAVHDRGQRGVNARISAYPVVLDGFYLVVISRFNGETGQTAGEFTLTAFSGAGAPTATPRR